jgi:predicted amidohydrolase
VDVPGPLTERLGEIARDNGVWLVPGSVYERGEGDGIHNTCLVLSPEGELAASYRKVFPWQPHESSAPGDRFTTFDVPDVGRIGLSICYDGSFPETCRQLAWMGAEVVLQPTLTTTSDRNQELVMARANAIFNQLYVVSLNAGSPAALGRSLIVDPEGVSVSRPAAARSSSPMCWTSTPSRACASTARPGCRGSGIRPSGRYQPWDTRRHPAQDEAGKESPRTVGQPSVNHHVSVE